MLALALSSCSTTQQKTGVEKQEQASKPGTREIPRTRGFPVRTRSFPTAHVWATLPSYGEEEEGYATYTYVLIGRDKSHKATWHRYNTLITAVTSSTAKNSTMMADKSLLNLFLIPVSAREGQNPTSPNDKLSMELLTALSTAFPGKFDNPGPYLITLYQPIRHGRPGQIADILFIDLSKMHEKAIQEVVRSYKTEIIKSEFHGTQKLEQLALLLLNSALSVEDSYGFVKIAFAELQKAWSASAAE
ncbi:MAG: hypothetical protein H0X43_07550 [Nitrosospira sp.]|nr:hypothetical protein [Nitrosospira sp.]